MRFLLIGIFWVGGAVLGWDTAVATHRTDHRTESHRVGASLEGRGAAIILPHSSTLMIVPVPGRDFTAEEERTQELERLKTRNRRLEALVRVLRNRQVERQP